MSDYLRDLSPEARDLILGEDRVMGTAILMEHALYELADLTGATIEQLERLPIEEVWRNEKNNTTEL